MMTKFRFTNRALQQLPPHQESSASRSAEYSDVDVVGLKALVNKQRRIYFYFRYTIRGQKRAAKIGEFPALDVAEARKLALEMRAMVDRGIDPQDERDSLMASPTFEVYVKEQYLPYAYAHKRSARDDESRLRIHAFPRFGKRKLAEIQTKEIQLLHADLKQSHCPATANRILSVLSKLFKLAVQWSMLEVNPCTNVTKFKENNQQQRFLTHEEIQRIYLVMESEKNKVAVAAIKLLLLTGVRREEALQAKWENVDLESAVWLIPLTKSGRARYVQLNLEAISLLSSIKRAGDSPWVFPGRDPAKPLNNPTKAFRRVLVAAGVDRLRLHDLRHTFASLAVNAGISLFQVQQLLHHSSSVTTQRYSHIADSTLRSASAKIGNIVSQAVQSKSTCTEEVTS